MTPTDRLLQWFAASARALPWRSEPRDPYLVLVSELMLQQTQVERVVPRFEAFRRRFPDLEALARASEDEVLDLWSGLGYYRRARLLHRLAREVAGDGGSLPTDVASLRRLPGIGPYTAAAVASLAFGRSEPVLDGNVMRVGARILALQDDPRSASGGKLVTAWVSSLIANNPPGAVNEALMELGATICLPRNPRCGRCPLEGGCRGHALGTPEAFPPPRPRREVEEHRWVSVCCVDPGGRWLLRQVSEGPILVGLWLPPYAVLIDDQDLEEQARSMVPWLEGGVADLLPKIRHSITHRNITVRPVRFLVEGADPPRGWRWVDPEKPGVPTSSLLGKLVECSNRWESAGSS